MTEIYKTLQDVERVISLGKPQSVIDAFVSDYLSGVAAQPYIEAEQEYETLQAQEDQPDVEPVRDPETGETIAEGYSPNKIRDDRIADLSVEFPYLTMEERVRPELELDYSLVADLDREYKKSLRSKTVNNLLVTTESGKVFDADETSQTRMARAIQVAEISGLTETLWGMGDNTKQTVTIAELKEALAKGLQAQAAVWFF